jgi:hypothetical protein
MPFFECKVSRSVLTADLIRVTRMKESVYVEAEDEIEAKLKAGHPANWLTKPEKLTFLLAVDVDGCRRLSDDEVKDHSASRFCVRA